MQKYTYICWIHTDAIIIKTPDDKVAVINDAHRKTQEDFFIKYFTSHLYLWVSKGLFQVCVWERAGDRTLLKYFDPEVMAVSVVSFSFSMVAQPSTGVNSSVCWLSLLHRVYIRLQLCCLSSTILACLCSRWTQLTGIQFVGLILPSNSHVLIWTRLHDYFRYLGTGMCHFRFLWNGLCDCHRAEITVIQFRGHSLPVRQSMRV